MAQGIRANPDQVAGLFRGTPKSNRSKPRVTVLPLRVIGSEPELSMLGDWVAEETCRSLSRSNFLMVISHLSSRLIPIMGRRATHWMWITS